MRRHPSNPVITPEMVRPSADGYRVRGVFNPGACRFGDEIVLLLRVSEDCEAGEGEAAVPMADLTEHGGRPGILRVSLDDPEVRLKDTRGIVYRGVDYLSTLSHIRLARSKDGVSFRVEDTPFLFPSRPREIFGVEDARVTRIGSICYINYTCVSPDGWATALASTTDFTGVDDHGIIFPPQNKDVSIFPERIGGSYFALHRPNNEGFGKPSIWCSESPDLVHWGNHRCVLRPRDTVWEEMKIGGGGPSLRIPAGWLQIYHAKGRDQIYSLFAVLLDAAEPWKVVSRGKKPLLVPETGYETTGFFPGVVFTNGVLPDGRDRLRIYYGACDESVCLAETTVDEVLATLG